jgi:hypothetical protein
VIVKCKVLSNGKSGNKLVKKSKVTRPTVTVRRMLAQRPGVIIFIFPRVDAREISKIRGKNTAGQTHNGIIVEKYGLDP